MSRAFLISADVVPVGSAERHDLVVNPLAGWSEQDPADWIAALGEGLGALCEKLPPFAVVKDIGVAGHMHGASLLGADRALIRPCFLWTASHGNAGCPSPVGQHRVPRVHSAGSEWVRAHEPGTFARVAKITSKKPGVDRAARRRFAAAGQGAFRARHPAERMPHNDTGIRVNFTGLGPDTKLDHGTRAMLEGVAFKLRGSCEALRATACSPSAVARTRFAGRNSLPRCAICRTACREGWRGRGVGCRRARHHGLVGSR